ncbi:EamA family transporter [Methylotetracoccus oryzae]|uniref:EamA family transporter n=1 Tax=Methylotetracoccus oryzae TaxID=1919059 RepID=UPI00111A8EBB|nr:EamA family transporter [Methylotetracoccus oryzae]
MWLIYALSAAVIWGISYAASGRAIARGVPPLVFFTLYAAVALAMGLATLLVTGRIGTLSRIGQTIGDDLGWLVLAVTTSGLGALLIYLAIGEKNATVASLIEISYPLFVALFAWLFFQEIQFNRLTVAGAALILSGVALVYLANR